MSLLPVRYATSIFCSNPDLAPSGGNATKLVTAFAKYDLIPTTFHEVIGPLATQRMRLATLTNEWGIDIGSERIDVEQLPVDKNGANMADLAAFCAKATDMIAISLKAFPRKAHRLAFASRDMMGELDEDRLAAVFRTISQAISYYDERPPFEWVHRAAARDEVFLSGTKESLNVISTLTRARGVIAGFGESKIFDRIVIEFDINTAMENRDTRFSSDHLSEFLSRALQLRSLILEQIIKMVK